MSIYQLQVNELTNSSRVENEQKSESVFGSRVIPVGANSIQRFQIERRNQTERVFVGASDSIDIVESVAHSKFIAILQDLPQFVEEDYGEKHNLSMSENSPLGVSWTLTSDNDKPGLLIEPTIKDNVQYRGAPRTWGIEGYDPPTPFDSLVLPVYDNAAYLSGLSGDKTTLILPNAKKDSPFVIEVGDSKKIYYFSDETNSWETEEISNAHKYLISQIENITCINADLLTEVVALVSNHNKNEAPIPAVVKETEDEETKHFFESGRFVSPTEVAKLFIVPEDINLVRDVLVFYAPARSGTSAFGFLMAGLDGVTTSSFQGFKGRLRGIVNDPLYLGKSDPGDKGVVVIKDTNGPLYPQEIFDPVEILRAAGMPDEKINVVFSLKRPDASFRSLRKFVPEMDPFYFAQMQQKTIELFHRYDHELHGKVTPFAFDLLQYGDVEIMGKVIDSTGLNLSSGWDQTLDFKYEDIRDKMDWGEANPVKHLDYYMQICFPTLARLEYRHVSNTTNANKLSDADEELVNSLCYNQWKEFETLSRERLGLNFL